MIQLSSLAAAMPHGPVRPAAPASGATGGFALPGAEAAPAEAGAIVVPGRQILAAPGKVLPELAFDGEAEGGDDGADSEDIAFAWFALPVAPQPAPVPPTGAPPRPIPAALDGTGGEVDLTPSLPIAGDNSGTEIVAPGPDAAPTPQLEPEGVRAGAEPMPIRLREAAPNAQLAPIETPAATAQRAAALFAAAPAIATPAAMRRTLVQDLLPALGSTAFADIVRPNAIAAPADVQQGMLDMRREEWMGRMVDQLEALRDASPARETRLSLAPEALGKVDVSIRQDGDRIHVHFATETPAARQLLTEAQPRLAELAEARGVKLGQTSVDGGGAGQSAPRDRQPEPASQPIASDAPDATITATDERIA